MSSVIFVTGNANKFYEASHICERYGITLEQQVFDIDEIQSHDPLKIVEAKVKSAYEHAQSPVVVNDSSWEIPALGGFPGGYMKDVTSWLSTEDFMNLMASKNDKRILLHECVAFYDGEILNMFTYTRGGHFIEKPQGKALPSFARLVQMDSDDMTISEIFDKGEWSTEREDEYRHWFDFAKWYQEKSESEI